MIFELCITETKNYFDCSMFLKIKSRLFPIVISLVTVSSLVYCFFYNANLRWYLLAHARLILIEVLPYWDWSHLGNKRCLLVNPFGQKDKPPPFDYNFCWPCETTKDVVKTDKLKKKDVQNIVNNLKKPMLFSNVTSLLTFESIDLDNFVDSDHWSPCFFQSNIKQKKFSSWVLRKNNNWFAQWQICDPQRLKKSREFYKKPVTFPNSLSCMGPNWLFLSKNYHARIHRPVNTVEEWVWFIQLLGDGHVQLIAPEECVDICLNLNISLKQGDSALIPQDIYYLQYMPNSNNLNIAIAVECHTN